MVLDERACAFDEPPPILDVAPPAAAVDEEAEACAAFDPPVDPDAGVTTLAGRCALPGPLALRAPLVPDIDDAGRSLGRPAAEADSVEPAPLFEARLDEEVMPVCEAERECCELWGFGWFLIGVSRLVDRLRISFPWTTRLSLDRFRSFESIFSVCRHVNINTSHMGIAFH